MLVLSRKADEKIIIDDSIVITVLSIRGDKVRIGIEAPKHVKIFRSEIYEHYCQVLPEQTTEQTGPEQDEVDE